MEQMEMLKTMVKVLDNKKAEDIKVIKVRDLTIIADYFIIAGGTSITHTRSLADELEYQMKELGVAPKKIEGTNKDGWVVLDYSDIVVHVFYKEQREFYNLERLWEDGEEVHLDI